MLTPIKRIYSNFAGVDFTNDPAKVALNRSPYCVNMYKNYESTQGQCVETRPGLMLLNSFENKINGIYIFDINNVKKAIVHVGTKLYNWASFPTSENSVLLYSDMNNAKSSMVVFEDRLYVNDGKNYLVYDGTTIKKVSEDAFVPTTTMGRLPASSGVVFQAVNVLTPKRKNSFVADGKSKEYYLDTVLLDEADVVVYINDTLVESSKYSVNRGTGCITFIDAPEAPLTDGQDNVVIEFEKTGTDYATRISNCNRSLVFDNRIFFTGNKQFKNAIFHSELQNPAYISDLAYYQDGTSDSAIKDFTIGNNLLWVFKEDSQQLETIFYHIPTIDSEYGKIYPSKQGNVSQGCISRCINFSDDIIFTSKNGLEGITGNILEEQITSHRSSLIDAKFVNENNYADIEFTEWNGYLLCLVDGKIYLADSRQKYSSFNSYEYEWYYWEFNNLNEKIVLLREYDGSLYLCGNNGNIYLLNGTNDDGNIIYSCWTTPNDLFGNPNHLKTTNKRGGIAKIKTIQNSMMKVSVETNKKDEKLVKRFIGAGFDFSNIDFGAFTFTTKNNSYVVYKIKQKKFIELKLKFYSDELDKPFGIYDATIEAYIGSYVKR